MISRMPTTPSRVARLALLLSLALALLTVSPVLAVPTLPVLWTAGGHDAGDTGAGPAVRLATGPSGTVAVLSAPSLAYDLAVTVYTADGTFLWRRAVAPTYGTFIGDWVAAAPNGDFLAVGRTIDPVANPVAITLVRISPDGALLWRKQVAGTRPSVGRLLVDAEGNAYLAYNALGEGQDIRLSKFNPNGDILWTQSINAGFMANDIATSLAFSPDQSEVALSGNVTGGTVWLTALYDTATGARRWYVVAPEGIANRDVVVDEHTVYVTGQGNIGTTGYLTVVAYDRVTGERLWRTDSKPADSTGAAGLRITLAPDGSIVVTGHTIRGFLDWYTVVLERSGALRWEAVRDGGLNTDEIPRALLVLDDGTVVVTGRGGPNLPGGYLQGVTAGYGADGTLLWEAFARMETVWATLLPSGDFCAAGGYDALVTCWQVPDGGPTPTALPSATATNLPPTATATEVPSPTFTATAAPPSVTPTIIPVRIYLPLVLR